MPEYLQKVGCFLALLCLANLFFITQNWEGSKQLFLSLQNDVDSEETLRSESLFSWLELKLPNVPVLFWSERDEAVRQKCGEFPSVLDLHYNNRYWQEVHTSQGTFFLYGAYLDKRGGNILIRILGMFDHLRL